MLTDMPLTINEEAELTGSEDSPPSLQVMRDTQPTFVGSVRVSESDISRSEMKWDAKIELRHRKWAKEAEQASILFEKIGKKKRTRHRVLGSFSTVVPILSAAVVKLPLDEFHASILVTLCFAFSGICSALYAFLNYQAQMQLFFEYASKYQAYAVHIMSILDKPRKFRKPADQSQTECELIMAHLNETAPTP